MITPDEIRDKLARLYPRAIQAWFDEVADFFPYRIPANLVREKSVSENILAVQALHAMSKSKIGYGYRVECELHRSRSHGENNYPQSLWIDSIDDLARVTGNGPHWKRVLRVGTLILNAYPVLRSWVRDNFRQLPDLEFVIDDLIRVTQYLLEHPRPNCFPRELPLAIPTKLIDQHQRLLSDWWDRLLPVTSIDHGCGNKNFAQRFGFRAVEQYLQVRILDRALKLELQLTHDEISLPVSAVAELLVSKIRVIIVENKVNLLTMPIQPRTIVMGGLGRNVAPFFSLAWLAECQLLYWGDIDLDGLEILAMLRHRWEHTQSRFMDVETLRRYQKYAIPWSGRDRPPPAELHAEERLAFEVCREQGLRLEQEHIPQSDVVQTFCITG